MKQREKDGTDYPMMFFMADSADHITGKTGLAPTVTISKNGAAFGAPAGAVTERASGWYALAGNATDRNTLGSLLLHATAAGADPADKEWEIVDFDPFTSATIADIWANATRLTLKKTVATSFRFFMAQLADGETAMTGLTITAAKISKDGGAFVDCDGLATITEIGRGWYEIALLQAETNADHILLEFGHATARMARYQIFTQATA